MASIIKLYKIEGKNTIVDNNGNIIVRDIHDADEINRTENDRIIRFMTNNNEYSYINSSGFFFDKYSYKEYDMVCELVPTSMSILKTKKNGKYGIINTYHREKRVLNCMFDKIEFLYSNIFIHSDIIKLKKDSKFSLIHGAGEYNEYKEYDDIYTPIQPLDKFIVCQNGKYGFIDGDTFKEIVEPTFDTIEKLCSLYKCDIDKYTKNLYIIEKKLKLKRVAVPELCYSYIVDANKIVKGKWGGNGVLISDCRTGEIYMHYLYHSSKNKKIPINMYGYFYNLFDCRTFDTVIHAIGKFYLVIKNRKYGLIDDEFHMILNLCYKDIHIVHFFQSVETPLFVVTCKKGEFLYNAETGMQTQLYDSLSWCDDMYISGYYRNYLVYEKQGKFGLLSPEGQIITKAKFDLYKINFIERDQIEKGHAYFQEIFHGHKYSFYIENNKFYGKVPIDKYDSCIQIGEKFFDNYYIIKIEGKYGLLNHQCKEIELPLLDDIIFAEDSMNSVFGTTHGCRRHPQNPISETFLIGRIGSKYYLYSIQSIENSQDATLIISDCDEMEIIEEKKCSGYGHEYPYVRFKKNGIEGYVNENGQIISTETFKEIRPIVVVGHNTYYYLTYKADKVGLLNSRRKVIFPCIYDDILKVTMLSAIVIENGVEREVKYNTDRHSNKLFDISEEPHHYLRYAGSYAQDNMGYSDEDIDTIFDGEPEAYWNID